MQGHRGYFERRDRYSGQKSVKTLTLFMLDDFAVTICSAELGQRPFPFICQRLLRHTASMRACQMHRAYSNCWSCVDVFMQCPLMAIFGLLRGKPSGIAMMTQSSVMT